MARRLLAEWRERLELACAFPDAGAPRFHLRPGVRAVVLGRRVAYHIVTDDALVVLRVLDAAQDVEGLAARGGFPTQ